LAIVASSRDVLLLQKQPSPRATMAARYATGAAPSYTTRWDTIHVGITSFPNGAH